MFKQLKYYLTLPFLIALFVPIFRNFQINNSDESNPSNEPKNMAVGTNLSPISYYSSEFPFIDLFKSSQNWITQSPQEWNTKEEHLLDLDSQGWVKSLPTEKAGIKYTKVGSLLLRGHQDYLPGNYIVFYEGEGNIEYKLDAKKNEALSAPRRDVIEVNPSRAGILLSITETDPNRTGDYIRDIRVVHESHESVASTEIFNHLFLEKIQSFDTLRFMDWMKTNNSEQKEWTDRQKPEDARYSNVNAPVEIMVELANQTDSNPWFTMPHQATNEYVENFANYVQENLKPGLKVYVEYSNEVWNWRFEQRRWVDEQVKQKWSDSSLNYLDWYSKRTTEIVEIWDEVFAEDSERVIGVMAAQAANVSTGQRVLDYNWSDTSLSHLETGIDAVAIAPYFGNYIGNPSNENQLETWSIEPDGGLNKLFQEITEGGLLSNSPEGGALNKAYGDMAAYAELAQQQDLQLLAYEGGQHLVGTKGLENNQAVSGLFIAANRDPRMGKIYRDYLEQWFNTGGDLFINFNNIETISKWGSWGALESLYQQGSPKYDAIIDFIQNANNNNSNVSED